jgi:metallophosphoesterase (TIGR03767 family)
MVRKLNTVQRGPVGHRPLDCLVTTGDLTNASALSELSAAVRVFAGKPVSSHPPGGYQGIQDHGAAPAELFRRIWHPEPETLLMPPDDWKAVHGYPTVPGLLAAATRPVPAEGADFPWYIGFGNHDEAGSVSDSPTPRTAFTDALRVSDRLPIQLPSGVDTSDFWKTVNGTNTIERSALMVSMPSRPVRASSFRRAFSKPEFMDALAGNAGHARFRSDSGATSRAEPYYTFEVSAQVLGIMLNTASPDTSTKAVIDAAQAQWLEDQLLRVSGKYYDPNGRLITTNVQDRLVVLFSHHPLFSFKNDERSSRGSSRPLNRSAVLGLLSRFPNVVAWLNGHRHKHRVTPHKSEHEHGGFWEITTASLIDYPQQSRIVEILDNGDLTLSITATLVDHSVPGRVRYGEDQTPRSLAALSLELATNRPGLDHGALIGQAADQNVDLLLRKPF